MKKLLQITSAIATVITVIGITSIFYSPGPVSAAPPNSDLASSQTNFIASQTNSAPAQTNSVMQKTVPPVAEKPVVRRGITGAELYSMHCNRCHPERYPTERTAAQWKTIMLHMQVRANLPADQAKLILKYLQDNSGR